MNKEKAVRIKNRSYVYIQYIYKYTVYKHI